MAHIPLQSTGSKSNIGQEEDYSVLQVTSGTGDSLLHNTAWPQDESFMTASEGSSSRQPYSSALADTDSIFASHYALATAYTRVVKKLAEAEKKNQAYQIQESLKARNQFQSRMSGSTLTPGNSNFSSSPFDIEASVNQAWDAYNEKCKECQQLRDELDLLKQKNQTNKHDSRIQGLREDVLRERAKQDDVVRKLEKTKMEADHLGKKETLAREELEKEREYQQSLMQSAERKRKELEKEIENLRKQLNSEKNLQGDILKMEKEKQKSLELEFNEKEEEYIEKVRSLEEKIISLKEEVSIFQSNPVYTNGPTSHVNHLNMNNMERDPMAKELYTEMENLKAELNDLRTRAAEQNHILTALFENPRIVSLTQSENPGKNRSVESMLISSSSGGNKIGPSNPLVQCSEQISIKRKKKNSPNGVNNIATPINQMPPNPPSSDVRQVIGSSMPMYSSFSSADIYAGGSYPQGNPQELGPAQAGCSTVFKTTEDFIRDITKDGGQAKPEGRRSSKAPSGSLEYTPIFPPVDVSRVIHVPNCTSPQTIPSPSNPLANNGGNPSNIYSQAYRNSNNLSPKHHAATDVQYSAYYNGNIPVHSKIPTDVLYPRGRPSLPALEVQGIGGKKMSALHMTSPGSTSSSDTVVTSMGSSPQRSKNPFYRDMAIGDAPAPSNVLPNSMRLVDSKLSHEFLKNLDMNESNSSPRNIMDMEIDDVHPPRPSHLQPTYQPSGAESYATPANRYISSDDENESGNFEMPVEGASSPHHQPKEFVVPRVVHASSLGPLGVKKAFQDSRYAAPASESHLRPSMRAKTEPNFPNAFQSRNRRQNDRTNVPGGTSPIDPLGDGPLQSCPICEQIFPPGTREDVKNRHINNHFSDDDDNDVLSFD